MPKNLKCQLTSNFLLYFTIVYPAIYYWGSGPSSSVTLVTSIIIMLLDTLVGLLRPGDNILLYGILLPMFKEGFNNNKFTLLSDKVFKILNITHLKKDFKLYKQLSNNYFQLYQHSYLLLSLGWCIYPPEGMVKLSTSSNSQITIGRWKN